MSAATSDPTVKRDLRKPVGYAWLRRDTTDIDQEIFSDAILAMIRAPASVINGGLELDEDFLRRSGVTDFDKYSLIPGAKPRRIMPADLPTLTGKSTYSRPVTISDLPLTGAQSTSKMTRECAWIARRSARKCDVSKTQAAPMR